MNSPPVTSAVASARSLVGTPAVVFAARTLWSEKSPWPTLVVSIHQLTTEFTSIGCGRYGGVLLAGHEQAGPIAPAIRGCRVTTREAATRLLVFFGSCVVRSSVSPAC
jgi:hypothetical protein